MVRAVVEGAVAEVHAALHAAQGGAAYVQLLIGRRVVIVRITKHLRIQCLNRKLLLIRILRDFIGILFHCH